MCDSTDLKFTTVGKTNFQPNIKCSSNDVSDVILEAIKNSILNCK